MCAKCTWLRGRCRHPRCRKGRGALARYGPRSTFPPNTGSRRRGTSPSREKPGGYPAGMPPPASKRPGFRSTRRSRSDTPRTFDRSKASPASLRGCPGRSRSKARMPRRSWSRLPCRSRTRRSSDRLSGSHRRAHAGQGRSRSMGGRPTPKRRRCPKSPGRRAPSSRHRRRSRTQARTLRMKPCRRAKASTPYRQGMTRASRRRTGWRGASSSRPDTERSVGPRSASHVRR